MHCLQFIITNIIFGLKKLIFLIDDVINIGMPHGRPRLAHQCFHVELCEDTCRRWKEAKQQMNFGRDNTLAVHIYLVPDTTGSRQRCLQKQHSFFMDAPSIHCICALKSCCIIGLCCYFITITNTCMATKAAPSNSRDALKLRSLFLY